jgi:signal transduction histidine kinase
MLLIFSIVVTIITWQLYLDYAYQSAEIEFDKEAHRIVNKIEVRMSHYGETLYAARGLFSTSNNIERDEWFQFIKTQKIAERFPGIQGVGFQKRTSDPDVFHKDMDELRVLGLLNREPPAINSDGYYRYIFYLEPVDERNKSAYGYDMFSEPIRRTAIERSRDRDAPALSGKVMLVQEITEKKQSGFLLYLPIYENGKSHDTIDERNANLIGNVYEPFRADDLMSGILSEELHGINFYIFDNIASDENLLYVHKSIINDEPIFTKNVFLNIYGRTWILSFFGYSDLISTISYTIGYGILVIGILFSIFVFFITGKIILLNNIRHRRELENKIIEASHRSEINNLENINRLKTEFISMVSHELKTPLVSIQGYAELLDMELKNISNDQKEELAEIIKNSVSLNLIINDLLDAQKLDLGKIVFHKSQTDIVKLIKTVISSFKLIINEKHIRVETHISESLVILVDESRLIQILNNLVKNSIEAIPHDNGMITISVKKESNNTIFSIKDNGVGMSGTQLGDLFKKFYQSNTTLARKKNGSGLGLYISHELVLLHGGKIWVESELHKGTTFYFTIPS